MPSSRDPAPPGGDEPALSLWERVKYTLVRPDDDPSEPSTWPTTGTVEELRAAIRRSDDKERAIGCVAAPLAAIVGIIISSAS